MTALTDSLPASTSSGSGLVPPSLSASSFGRPTSSFKREEEERKKERTLSGEGMSGGFDPTKAFGERRGSRSASNGGGADQGLTSREAVRREAGERKEGMGSVLEEDRSPAVSWAPPPIVATQDQQAQQPSLLLPPHQQNTKTVLTNPAPFALTPGLDAIPFSDSFGKALEEKINASS